MALTWVGVPGLEPGTSSLSGKRSNRLSYTPKGSAARHPGFPKVTAAPAVAATAILYRIPATTRIDGITGPGPPVDQSADVTGDETLCAGGPYPSTRTGTVGYSVSRRVIST